MAGGEGMNANGLPNGDPPPLLFTTMTEYISTLV